MSSEYVSGPYLKENFLEERKYQTDLVEASKGQNTLIALPTGAGKTIIAVRLMLHRLNEYPEGKVVFAVPNTPLTTQHVEFIQEATNLSEDEVVTYTGDTRPDNREDVWERARVVVATPQTLQNDIMNNRISFSDASHMVFDECHKAKKNHAYNYIAEKYMQSSKNPLVTGISASPGSNEDEILTVCENLHISNVEIKNQDDESLSNYLHETDFTIEELDLTEEIRECIDLLLDVQESNVELLVDKGVINSRKPRSYAKNLSHGKINSLFGRAKGDEFDDQTSRLIMSFAAEMRTINRFIGTLGSEGPYAFCKQYERHTEKVVGGGDNSKADERLLDKDKVQSAYEKALDFVDSGQMNRKTQQLVQEVIETLPGKTLVFTESRDTVDHLLNVFNTQLDNISAGRLVGKSSKGNKEGMNKSEQREAINKFDNGEFDVLISTSVGEEGLDIPAVDLVVFHEPVSKGIRSIQRSGRTGRQTEGRVKIFVMNDTKDEAYLWKSRKEKKNMREEMESLKNSEDSINKLLEDKREQSDLSEFEENIEENDELVEETNELIDDELDSSTEVEESSDTEDETVIAEDSDDSLEFEDDSDQLIIYADNRETNSEVVRLLDLNDDIDLRLRQLDVGDYVVAPNIAFERKSVSDLHGTITGEDRDLFQQLKDLKYNYEYGGIILEGTLEELYNINTHENSIRGILRTFMMMGVYFLPARNEEDTAYYIESCAERAQTEERLTETIRTHAKKSTMSLQEQQEYTVSSIANIGLSTARDLLDYFESVEDVFTATDEELQEVHGIGEKTAEKITTVSKSSY